MLRAVGFYIVFIWLATAYYAYRDMSHRTTNPVAPYLAAALIILFTPILFLFAFVLYRILRPQETVADAQERALAEEAMLVEVERQAHCANCGRTVHADWIICPTCRNRLRRFCPNCSNLVELDWSLCPWCGKDFERPEQLPERVRVGRPTRPSVGPCRHRDDGAGAGGRHRRSSTGRRPALVAAGRRARRSRSVSTACPAGRRGVQPAPISPALAPSMAATTAGPGGRAASGRGRAAPPRPCLRRRRPSPWRPHSPPSRRPPAGRCGSVRHASNPLRRMVRPTEPGFARRSDVRPASGRRSGAPAPRPSPIPICRRHQGRPAPARSPSRAGPSRGCMRRLVPGPGRRAAHHPGRLRCLRRARRGVRRGRPGGPGAGLLRRRPATSWSTGPRDPPPRTTGRRRCWCWGSSSPSPRSSNWRWG